MTENGMQRAVRACGSQAALGAELFPPVQQQVISKWAHRGWPPPDRVEDVRRVAREYGVEIPRAELVRPEVAAWLDSGS